MRYIFVINGRKGFENILPDLQRQLAGRDLEYDFYTMTGQGDGTRYVRLYCDFHEKEDVCFVACGGCGTMNEVMSGIVGAKGHKCMAILAYGETNDTVKYWPDRDFTSLDGILSGEPARVDVIKCNDDYALNMINIGFDAIVSNEANLLLEEGKSNAYEKGIVKAFMGHRHYNFMTVADGRDMSFRRSLMCAVANGRYCGGKYYCSPKAVNDDGFMEICLIKCISLLSILIMMPKYAAGKFFDSDFCMRRIHYKRARHLEISSKDLIYVSLDGEITASTNLVIDVLEKAIEIVLPPKKEEVKP